MLPHEKALVKRLEKEPFALIGIDTDPELEPFRALLEKQGITWRNVWEGPVRPGDGPLSSAWNVRQYPTVYVIDARGIIRAQDPGDLDAAVDPLVAEAKAGAANRRGTRP
jgi:hypothetical protein